MSARTSPVTVLNVGGQLFTTTSATLTSPAAQGSMLAALVGLSLEPAGAEVMQATCTDPKHPGALFIDRDGSTFAYILNYLRDGSEVVLPSDLHTLQLLMREARYYQLPGLIELLEDAADILQLRAAEEAGALADLRTICKGIHQCSRSGEKLADLLEDLKGTADSMDTALAALRRYLAPSCLYHTGKRGGPNYNRPRQLLDDVDDLIAAASR